MGNENLRVICPRCQTANLPANNRCFDCFLDLSDLDLEEIDDPYREPVYEPSRSLLLLQAGIAFVVMGLGLAVLQASGEKLEWGVVLAAAVAGSLAALALILILRRTGRLQDLWRLDPRHPRALVGPGATVGIGAGMGIAATRLGPSLLLPMVAAAVGWLVVQMTALLLIGSRGNYGLNEPDSADRRP